MGADAGRLCRVLDGKDTGLCCHQRGAYLIHGGGLGYDHRQGVDRATCVRGRHMSLPTARLSPSYTKKGLKRC